MGQCVTSRSALRSVWTVRKMTVERPKDHRIKASQSGSHALASRKYCSFFNTQHNPTSWHYSYRPCCTTKQWHPPGLACVCVCARGGDGLARAHVCVCEGVILPSRRHLAVSGGAPGCHNRGGTAIEWWAQARDAVASPQRTLGSQAHWCQAWAKQPARVHSKRAGLCDPAPRQPPSSCRRDWGQA